MPLSAGSRVRAARRRRWSVSSPATAPATSVPRAAVVARPRQCASRVSCVPLLDLPQRAAQSLSRIRRLINLGRAGAGADCGVDASQVNRDPSREGEHRRRFTSLLIATVVLSGIAAVSGSAAEDNYGVRKCSQGAIFGTEAADSIGYNGGYTGARPAVAPALPRAARRRAHAPLVRGASRALPTASELVDPAVELTRRAVEVIVGIFFLFASAAYWITERERVEKIALSLLPQPRRQKASHTWNLIDLKLGAFVRGQLILILLVGTVLSLVFWA